MMTRITVEHIESALRKTGFTLKQGVTLRCKEKVGCPLGVIAHMNGVKFSGLGLRYDYIRSFMQGFDAVDRLYDGPEADQGFLYGEAARSLLPPSA